MSKFTFAFTKEKKQFFTPNGDKSKYVTISGCPIESVNGTYYLMDPITINDKTFNLCFTNGVYLLEAANEWNDNGNLYELSNSILIKKFYFNAFTHWHDAETLEHISEMESKNIRRLALRRLF